MSIANVLRSLTGHLTTLACGIEWLAVWHGRLSDRQSELRLVGFPFQSGDDEYLPAYYE